MPGYSSGATSSREVRDGFLKVSRQVQYVYIRWLHTDPASEAPKFEIRPYRVSTSPLLSPFTFRRIVTKISRNLVPGVRFDVGASLALQAAAEGFLVALFRGMLCYVTITVATSCAELL